jgi:Zn-dependent protease
VGLVLSIYVHEMGHVWAFRRFGIPASAPMFIPGIGAFVRSQMAIPSPEQGARIGLAGPWWGLGAAIAFEAAYWYTDSRWLSAVAHTGAVINLFNLLPVFGLDGDHAWRVLRRQKRILLLASILLFWYMSGETMFFIVALGAAWRCFSKDLPNEEDDSIFWQTLGLLAAFGLLCAGTAHWDRDLIQGS